MLRILRYVLFHQVGNNRPADVRTHMQRSLSISNFIVSFGLFSILLGIKLDLPSYIGPNSIGLTDILMLDFRDKLPRLLDGMGRLVAARWFDLIFAGFVMLWFFAYRAAAATETDLLCSFYADDNPPDDWDRIFGGKLLPLVALGLTVAFILLAWFIDNLLMFCAVMLVLLMQDAFGNLAIPRNMLAHYHSAKYALRPDDPMTPRLQKRRDIALGHWVWRPHLTRIGLLMCGTAFVAAGAIWSREAGFVDGEVVLRCALMAMIAANEATMLWWRLQRDEALAAVDEDDPAPPGAMPVPLA